MTKERIIEIEFDGFKIIARAQNVLLEAQIAILKSCGLVDGEPPLSQSVINATTVLADEVCKQAELLTLLMKEKKNG